MVKKGGSLNGKEINDFIKASYSKNRPEKIGNYELDKELSKASVVVYHNPITKKAVITHRGTEPTLKDWTNNLAFATGQYEKTDRYKRSKKAQERAESKYGAENIQTLGHSQGAILASKLGQNTKNIINVNPAYLGKTTTEKETNIRSSGDIVSSLLNPISSIKNIFGKKDKGKIETIQAESYNPLTEHKSDILLKDPEKIYGGKLKMNKEKIAFLKENGIVIRKVRGQPYYDIKIGKKTHSRHSTKKECKCHLLGGSFWRDFSHGFKEGFLGTAKAVQGVATFNPDYIEQGAKRISSGAKGK